MTLNDTAAITVAILYQRAMLPPQYRAFHILKYKISNIYSTKMRKLAAGRFKMILLSQVKILKNHKNSKFLA